jgi:hypothetical protein
MKRQSNTDYTTRATSASVLIALVSTFTVSAQTDVGCRQRQFGKFSEWSAAVDLGPVVNSNLTFWPSISPNGLNLYFGSNSSATMLPNYAGMDIGGFSAACAPLVSVLPIARLSYTRVMQSASACDESRRPDGQLAVSEH